MNDKLRHLLERVSAAIPTGWLVSDECSGLVLVKVTMQGLEETGVKSCTDDFFIYSVCAREKSLSFSNTTALKDLPKLYPQPQFYLRQQKPLIQQRFALKITTTRLFSVKVEKGILFDEKEIFNFA